MRRSVVDEARSRLYAKRGGGAFHFALDELRYFGGLTIEVLGISPATAKREWVTAKAWLHHELKREAGA
jgi:ECF sigma factor